MTSTARQLRKELNTVLAGVHDVALGKDVKLFLKVWTCFVFAQGCPMHAPSSFTSVKFSNLQVIVGLWLLSVVGGWTSLLTLSFIGTCLSHLAIYRIPCSFVLFR